MRLVVVGCAGSFAGPHSPASSYLVQAEDADGRTWTVVLDLGNGALGALQRAVDPFALDAVALSHLHPDHFVDLCGLYVYRRYHPEHGVVRTGRLDPLAVWGPSGTERRVGEAYGVESGEDMRSVFAFETWDPARPVQVGPLEVRAVPVHHPVEAYAFRITGPSASGGTAVLAYTGDTDLCDGVVEVARDADLLLAEAAFQDGRDAVRGVHLTGTRAGEVATAAGARSVVLTHLPAWTDAQQVLAAARAAYDGPLALAQQGAVHEV